MHQQSILFPSPIEDTRICELCEEPFARGDKETRWKYNQRRFCSRACRSRHTWETKREAYRDAGEKRCTKCQLVKPLEAFRASYAHPDALQPSCTGCQYKERHDRYWSDPEAHRVYVRAWQRRHPEKMRARWRRYQTANHEQLLMKWRRYHDRHREERLKSDRLRRSAIPADIKRAYNHVLYQLPGRRAAVIERANEYRARKARVDIGNVRFGMVIREHGPFCYLCDIRLALSEVTLDHVIPISRGGAHSMENVRPCCRSCNSRKGARLWSELEIAYPEMAGRIKEHLA